MKTNPALLALAIGAFGIGVTEFTPMGMLPLIAGDLGVSIPSAGLLVSAYALGVLVGAPVTTLAFARAPRRGLLVGLMGLFTVGNLLAACAPGYTVLMFARVLTSFDHGAYFGVGSVVAASLVPADRRAAAMASMFAGLTIATIGGVPLAAWVGQMLGWRASFFGIAGIGVVAMISLRLALPPLRNDGASDVRGELRVLARRPVLEALALTVVSSSAMFTMFTYIVPILKSETMASTGFVTAMLVVFGVGLTAGNWLGGRFADRSLDGTLMCSLAAVVLLLLAFAALMRSEAVVAILVFLWGAASFALVAPLQMRVMVAASEAPNLASAMNIGAFNLGNAIGAAFGGWVIGAGFGFPAVPVAAAAMASAGLLMSVALRTRQRALAAVAARC